MNANDCRLLRCDVCCAVGIRSDVVAVDIAFGAPRGNETCGGDERGRVAFAAFMQARVLDCSLSATTRSCLASACARRAAVAVQYASALRAPPMLTC